MKPTTPLRRAVMLFGLVALAAIYGHAQSDEQFGGGDGTNPWPSIGTGSNSNPYSPTPSLSNNSSDNNEGNDSGNPFGGGSNSGGTTSGSDPSNNSGSNNNDSGDGSGNNLNGGGNNGAGDGSDGYGYGNAGGGGGGIEPAPTALNNKVDMYNLMFTLPVAHGVLSALAFGFFFPLGSILMRVIPGRAALYAHGFTQLFAYATYIAGAGLGIYFISLTRIAGTDSSILESAMTNAHPIIGLLLLVAFFFQPIFGIVHHARFKKAQKKAKMQKNNDNKSTSSGRTWVSYVHLWIGRLGITLGIINGGLGFALAKWNGAPVSTAAVAAYAIIAGFVWLVWVLTSLRGEYRRRISNLEQHEKAIRDEEEEGGYRPAVRGGGTSSPSPSPSQLHLEGRHNSPSSVSRAPVAEAGLPPYEPGPNYAAHTAHLRRGSFDRRREMTMQNTKGDENLEDRRPDPGPIQSATEAEMRRGQV